jgi:hypothetical protein
MSEEFRSGLHINRVFLPGRRLLGGAWCHPVPPNKKDMFGVRLCVRRYFWLNQLEAASPWRHVACIGSCFDAGDASCGGSGDGRPQWHTISRGRGQVHLERWAVVLRMVRHAVQWRHLGPPPLLGPREEPVPLRG